MSYNYNSIDRLRYATDKLSFYSTADRCRSLSEIYTKIVESGILDKIIYDYKEFRGRDEHFADAEYEKMSTYPQDLVITVHSMIPEIINIYNKQGSIKDYEKYIKKLSIDFLKAAESISNELNKNDDKTTIDNLLNSNSNITINEINFSLTKAKGFLKIIDDLDNINQHINVQNNHDIEDIKKHYNECKEYDLFFIKNFNKNCLLDNLIDFSLIVKKEQEIEFLLNNYNHLEFTGSANSNYME